MPGPPVNPGEDMAGMPATAATEALDMDPMSATAVD
jgi:hypothetical protein